MNFFSLPRSKTQDIIEKHIHRRKLEFPTFERRPIARKNSHYLAAVGPNNGAQAQPSLITRSWTSQTATKQTKRYYTNPVGNSAPSSPHKHLIKTKNMEFPEPKNSQENIKSLPKTQSHAKVYKNYHQLSKVVRDCQLMVKVVSQAKQLDKSTPSSIQNKLEQVCLKNISLPPNPYHHLDHLKGDLQHFQNLMKLVQVKRSTSPSRIHNKQNNQNKLLVLKPIPCSE